LAPGAAVRGDAISVGGHVSRDSDAILQGDAVDLSGDLGTLSERTLGRVIVLPSIPRSLLGVLFTELQLLGSFLVAFLVGALAPARVRRAASFLNRRPLISALSGLLLALLTVPATVVLAVSVIGIPLIPALALLLLVLLGAGMATLAVWLGDALPFLRGGSTLATLLLGYLTLALLALIPFLGPLLLPLANLLAAGAVVASGLGRGPAA
ncbi:MAG: hypothetical protein KC420_12135, partial [Myxococcales bacterium]|nr:hypothetical protein [Myxococcales bacterium]